MHVIDICEKAIRIVGIIEHKFSRIDIDMYQILFKSLVRHILEYCSSVWSSYVNVSARKIKQIQRRGTKMVENSKDESYSDRFSIIGIVTLQLRRLRTDMIQVCKTLSRYEYIDTECIFTVDSDSYTRGHPFKLKKD